MYYCIDCMNWFEKPTTQYDELNDEQYDLCPHCQSDNITTEEEREDSHNNHLLT